MEKIVITDRDEMINTLTKVGYPVKDNKIHFWYEKGRISSATIFDGADRTKIIRDIQNIPSAREESYINTVVEYQVYVDDIISITLILPSSTYSLRDRLKILSVSILLNSWECPVMKTKIKRLWRR